MMKDLITALVFVEDKIQYADSVNRFQFKIPTTLMRLILNWKGQIINASILKIVLFFLLNLDDKLLTLIVFSINVEDGFPFATSSPELFR